MQATDLASDMPLLLRELSARCGVRDGEHFARRLNESCQCLSLDRAALRSALWDSGPDAALCQMMMDARPHMLSDTVVFVGERDLRRMAEVAAAVERVTQLPAYRERVLARAPQAARHDTAARGVFLGFDFHLAEAGPQLIEINTNAGGGLVHAAVARAQRACCGEVERLLPVAHAVSEVEAEWLTMFQSEWHAVRGATPLAHVAIVDDAPQDQYLFPEFVLFQRLFERHGIAASIADPKELERRDGRLWLRGQPVDLVYNRLTDFYFRLPEHAVLLEAWLADEAVITPHPRAHALYADKRNLALLSDGEELRAMGADEPTRAVLAAAIPATRRVDAGDAQAWWAERRDWFFKPATGYGSKAAYRGDKLTRRVFGEILAGDYVAQRTVEPSERRVEVDGVPQELKLDLRNYAYAGHVQLVGARLYRGQTTNFRTPGGGFATVVPVPEWSIHA